MAGKKPIWKFFSHFAMALLWFSSPAFSYEVVRACVEYVGTGQKYQVETSLFDGSELNERTDGFTYNSFAKYAVIFWGGGKATVIEFDSSFCPGITGCDGKDQNSYIWRVETNSHTCF